jgi:6,7-dimethyl-8-ribityllumazine synthase
MNTFEGTQDGSGLKVGIVCSRFNEFIVQALLDGARRGLERCGVREADIDVAWVPGAYEIPVVTKAMATTGRYDALVTLGAVIRGETYHFELVSNESASGITRISIDSGLAIANGVLTCETEEQAQVRVQVKGADCAKAVVEMANLALALTPDIDFQINPSEEQFPK